MGVGLLQKFTQLIPRKTYADRLLEHGEHVVPSLVRLEYLLRDYYVRRWEWREEVRLLTTRVLVELELSKAHKPPSHFAVIHELWRQADRILNQTFNQVSQGQRPVEEICRARQLIQEVLKQAQWSAAGEAPVVSAPGIGSRP